MRYFNLKLLVSLILCESAGLVGSIFTVSSIKSWYVFLNKPSFSPPNWLFGPVWTLLYFMMGISFYLVWQKGARKKNVRSAMSLFLFHLVVNSLWSVIFFGLRNPLLALSEIALLWGLIVFVMLKFQKIDYRAFLLLIPYFLWVSFATILNYNIVVLNTF